MAKHRAGSNRAIRKRAVCVGINQYPQAPLRGCVNDALMMSKLLVEHYGFQTGGEMRLLVDQRATKAAILERLAWLVDGARAGDILVFHYSGHGAQVPDRSGDEVDQMDECLCPIDHDWDNPLTDDDLAQILATVPADVNMTLVLDACHSGTGTRDLCLPSAQPWPQRIKRLIPPPDICFRAAEDIEVTAGREYYSVSMRGVRPLNLRRFGQAATQQNAILIAACRSDQVSQDAYLDGDYHGALTYSLYQAQHRLGPAATYAQWLEETSKVLQGYQISGQEPQLECPTEMTNWQLFATAPMPKARAAAVANKSVVYVHGIGPHAAGYSDPWWQAMEPFVPSVPAENHGEVLWSDLVNSTSRDLTPPAPGQLALGETLRETLWDRTQRQQASRLPRATETRCDCEELRTRALLGIPGLEGVDDFVRYLLQRHIRDQVLARFFEVVQPLLQAGSAVNVISHSWGTVVAYEGLRLLDREASSGKGVVSNFFTLGSALSIPAIRRYLLPEAADGKKPRLVRRWCNLDAQYDVVGGPLRTLGFEVDLEFLELKAVGCHGPIPSPVCAHSSYFQPNNLAVNRDILGRYIEQVAIADSTGVLAGSAR